MNRATRQLAENYRQVSSDIFKFCEAMNFTPTRQQRELLYAVQMAHMGRGSNWIACRSGQGPGKTTASVMVGLFRALQYDIEGGGARTIVTAPTMGQCRDVWLAEARLQLKKADPWLRRFINITMSRVEIGGDPDWGVRCVTAVKEENAQGRHNKKQSIIVEEASGVASAMITQYEGTGSNPDSLLLMIGNPNTRDCAFFDAFYGVYNRRYVKLAWNAEDTAREYPHIVNPQRNIDISEKYGRDSDVYRIRVMGEFPSTEPNCVIDARDLDACNNIRLAIPCSRMEREIKCGGGIAKQFGIDLARFGGDESTIFRRHGNAIMEWTKFVRREPSDVIDHSFRMQKLVDWKDEEAVYVVDAGGMGQGVMSRLYQANKRVVEFHNGGSAVDKQFDNKITEAWFHLSRLLKGRNAYVPKDSLLDKQLTTRRYYVTNKGKIILETKDEYIKRGFESPDRGDGIVYSFWDHIHAMGNFARKQAAEHESAVA